MRNALQQNFVPNQHISATRPEPASTLCAAAWSISGNHLEIAGLLKCVGGPGDGGWMATSLVSEASTVGLAPS